MVIEFKVYAALHEDIAAPYVWLSECPDMDHALAVLRITQDPKKRVVCQVREIDPNYRAKYNASEHTRRLPDDKPVAVMSMWYRDLLGAQKGEAIGIEVEPVRQGFPRVCWAQLQFSRKHPDHSVRIAANLGIVSVLLGLLGFALGIVSLVK